MRKRVFLLSLCALLFVQLTASAQSADTNKPGVEDVPPVILSGLQGFKDKGPEEAVRIWIKDSPIDGSKEAVTQANSLRQVQDFYGAYQSFEVLIAHDLGHRTRVLYLTLEFEKGPLFAKFVVYRSNHRWILTSFNFNTKEELILPPVQ
jgi:hypothetical protein